MRVRIINLKRPPVSIIMDADEIAIGRKSSKGGGADPDLSLEDREVSRKHARLWEENGKWYIADLMSKNGTFVEGEDIRGFEKMEIEAGTKVEIGSTCLILIPADWFVVSHEIFVIFAKSTGVFNCAEHHCGRSFIDSLHVMNAGDSRAGAIELTVRLEGYGDVFNVTVPVLNPGERIRMESIRPLFRLNAFGRYEQAVKTRLMMKIGNSDRYDAVCEITALGFWDWVYDARFPESAAAFVFPRDHAVRDIVRNAESLLKGISGHTGYSGLIASGSGDTEILVMKALYLYLLDKGNIGYEYPCLNRNESGFFHQTVKPPCRIMPADTGSGNATCLDLTLMFAACCENVGLFPLVFFTGTGDAPVHALAGCWVGATPGARPVIRSIEYIREELASGNLIAVECTGFASKAGGRQERIGFAEAVKSAREHLLAAEWVCAVDVCAVRPPIGNILPMDNACEPRVSEIHEIARTLAVDKHKSRIETSFLLYGLLMKPGETARLLAAEKIDAASVCLKLESLIPEGDSTLEPVMTNSYRECMYLAEEYAIEGKSGMVRERDLWRAIIRTGRSNKNLTKLCPLLGIDMARIERLLEELYPRPDDCNSESFGLSL